MTTKTKVRTGRLLRLASFLEKLPSRKFHFGYVVVEFDTRKNCGSVCCAVGWTPKLWPNEVRWVGTAYGANIEGGYTTAARNLFGMTQGDAAKLFTPHMCLPPSWERSGILPLDERASPKSVAANIRAYVKMVKES